MIYRPQRVCLFGGVLLLGGCLVLGGTWSGGGGLVGIPACTEADPPGETATAADGTHPTGMHSCLSSVCSWVGWTWRLSSTVRKCTYRNACCAVVGRTTTPTPSLHASSSTSNAPYRPSNTSTTRASSTWYDPLLF